MEGGDLVYIDTHIVVWLYLGKEELFGNKIKALINDSNLFYSPMIELELQYLYEIERIKVKPKKILDFLYEAIGLEKRSVNFGRVIKKTMDMNWTRDPFDRIITAQAVLENSILITKDETIRSNYKKAYWK